MHQMRAVVWVSFGQRVESEVQFSQNWKLIQHFHLFEGRYAVIVQDQPLQQFQMLNPLRRKQQILPDTFRTMYVTELFHLQLVCLCLLCERGILEYTNVVIWLVSQYKLMLCSQTVFQT